MDMVQDIKMAHIKLGTGCSSLWGCKSWSLYALHSEKATVEYLSSSPLPNVAKIEILDVQRLFAHFILQL